MCVAVCECVSLCACVLSRGVQLNRFLDKLKYHHTIFFFLLNSAVELALENQ